MAIADLADLAAATGPGWRECQVCHALADLPTDKATLLRQLLASPMIRYSDLSHELSTDPDWQIDIDPGTLSRHARGRCSAREQLR